MQAEPRRQTTNVSVISPQVPRSRTKCGVCNSHYGVVSLCFRILPVFWWV